MSWLGLVTISNLYRNGFLKKVECRFGKMSQARNYRHRYFRDGQWFLQKEYDVLLQSELSMLVASLAGLGVWKANPNRYGLYGL